jgi:5-hydroxyisourate hydrolase
MTGGISIHAVDVVSGRPAIGMEVSLRRMAPDPQLIASGVIGPDGTLAGPHVTGHGIVPGEYEVVFAFDSFYRNPQSESAFLRTVPFRFHILSANEHVHLPIKLSPWGFAMFRGL